MERLGQAFLRTDQPDHRQRIPVTLLEVHLGRRIRHRPETLGARCRHRITSPAVQPRAAATIHGSVGHIVFVERGRSIIVRAVLIRRQLERG